MDDPAHYCKMITSIKKTIQLQTEIDKFFFQIEKALIILNR